MYKQTTASSPDDYIEALDEPRRDQVRRLDELIRETAPELEPHIAYGMLGYGRYHYKYASGREGDASIIGLASHKNYISLYVSGLVGERYVAETYKERLPKADIGKSCVRIKRLDDVDEAALRSLVREGADLMNQAEAPAG
jgi:hypothetical protein